MRLAPSRCSKSGRPLKCPGVRARRNLGWMVLVASAGIGCSHGSRYASRTLDASVEQARRKGIHRTTPHLLVAATDALRRARKAEQQEAYDAASEHVTYGRLMLKSAYVEAKRVRLAARNQKLAQHLTRLQVRLAHDAALERSAEQNKQRQSVKALVQRELARLNEGTLSPPMTSKVRRVLLRRARLLLATARSVDSEAQPKAYAPLQAAENAIQVAGKTGDPGDVRKALLLAENLFHQAQLQSLKPFTQASRDLQAHAQALKLPTSVTREGVHVTLRLPQDHKPPQQVQTQLKEVAALANAYPRGLVRVTEMRRGGPAFRTLQSQLDDPSRLQPVVGAGVTTTVSFLAYGGSPQSRSQRQE